MEQEVASGGRHGGAQCHQQLQQPSTIIAKNSTTHTLFIRQQTTETEKSIFLLRAECLWLMSMLDAESHK